MYCYHCGEESSTASDRKEDETLAGESGWGMGLDEEGQAHYTCPDCAGGLFNFTRFVGYRQPDGSIAK